MKFMVLSVLILIIDVLAITCLLNMVFHGYASDGAVRKLGIAMMLIGVFAQAMQCLYIIMAGHLISYLDWPLWVLKDVGIALWAIGLQVRERQYAGKP